jgi:Secretion system C-terminal sorting domain
MKKLLLSLFIVTIVHSFTKAQCPPGATAIEGLNPQCPSGCMVLLLNWPEGSLVIIYGGNPIDSVTSVLIPGIYGSGRVDNGATCVPCNTPLIYASAAPNATNGCVVVTNGIIILPVKLIDFSATAVAGKSYMLKWTASEETGGAKYIIQRSRNSQNFEDIKTVLSYDNGKLTNSYSYEDPSVLTGNNYYRLKVVEITGNITYSPIAIVRNEPNAGFSVYPNPLINDFTVTLSEKLLPAVIEVYNVHGQSIYKSKTTQSLVRIDEHLKNGVYVIKVTGNNNISATQKLIKK